MPLLRLLLHRLPLLCCLLLAPEVQLLDGSTEDRRQSVPQSCRLEEPLCTDQQCSPPPRQSVQSPISRLLVRQHVPAIESDWLICKRLIELLQ